MSAMSTPGQPVAVNMSHWTKTARTSLGSYKVISNNTGAELNTVCECICFIDRVMTIGSAAHKALTAVVLDKRWLTLVKKFLNFR
jgi:ABC-type enterobactin transport system permease subunit